MKKLLYIWAIALTLFSCEQNKTPEIPIIPEIPQQELTGCGVADDSTGGVTPEVMARMARVSMTPTVSIYCQVGYRYYKALNMTESQARAHVQNLFTQSEAVYASVGISIKLTTLEIITNPENPYTGKTSYATLLPAFAENKRSFPGDVGVYLDLQGGSGSGNAQKIGALGTDENRVVALIPTAFSEFPVFSHPVNVLTHELAHPLGANHTFVCVWNWEGQTNTALDDSGIRTGYGLLCRKGWVPPAVDFYTITSYGHALNGGRSSRLEFHHACVAAMKTHILANANKLGCWNTADGFVYENGVIAFTSEDDTAKATIRTYAPGASTFFKSATLTKQPTEIRLNPTKVSTYKSSNTTGWRFDFGQDITGYDLHYTLSKPMAAGGTLRGSVGFNTASLSGNTHVNSNPFPVSGFKVNKALNYVNLRPDKEVDGQEITAYLTKKRQGSGAFEWNPGLLAGKYYIVNVDATCNGGVSRQFWAYEQGDNWSGKKVYDSGGANGIYESNQDFTYIYPAGTKIVFDPVYLQKGDTFTVTIGETTVNYLHGQTPLAIQNAADTVKIHFKSDSSSNAAGYGFTPTKL